MKVDLVQPENRPFKIFINVMYILFSYSIVTQMKTRNKRHSHNKTLKMNCHPNNKDKSHTDTCYTKDALLQIRDAYNQSHSSKIKGSRPMTVYNKLREKLSHCEKEDCWMDQIQDKNVKYELDKKSDFLAI